jgi:hypothetical protein
MRSSTPQSVPPISLVVSSSQPSIPYTVQPQGNHYLGPNLESHVGYSSCMRNEIPRTIPLQNLPWRDSGYEVAQPAQPSPTTLGSVAGGKPACTDDV